MTNPKILNIATAVPPHKISQTAHYEILNEIEGQSREDQLILRKIYNRCKIDYRHSVLKEFSEKEHENHEIFHPSGDYPNTPVATRMDLYEKYAADLCLKAAKKCMEALPDLKKTDITHVVTFSCTGMYAPGLDIQLVEKLDLNRSVERTCINFMGCYAAINALKTAFHISRSTPEAVILLGGVELCTLHYMKSIDPNQMVANSLFGDGAAAVIVSAKNFKNTENTCSLLLKNFYSEFSNTASEDMVWRIGNTGFDLKLTPEVPQIVKENIAPLLEQLFKNTGITKEQIDHYAIHPGGTKILEACEEALDLHSSSNEVSYEIMRDYGNMSSVTVLFVLEKHLKKLTSKNNGEKIMACAFGPGITMESMILEIN